MSGKHAEKLTSVRLPKTGAEPLADISIEEKRPVLGMTLLKITGSYSLDGFSKFSKKNPDRRIYSELLDLQREMYKCKSMTAFLKRFHTRNGDINVAGNKALKEEVVRIRNTFGADLENDIIHIHGKALGKGAFTLFGFVYDNVFEVLLLDPEHEVANL